MPEEISRPIVATQMAALVINPQARLLRSDLRLVADASLMSRIGTYLAATPTAEDLGVPILTGAPTKVIESAAGTDGVVYFIPFAKLAQRSRTLPVPQLFLERRDGKVWLQAWFDLMRFPSLPTQSKPLPVDGFTAALVGGDGTRIPFARVEQLPVENPQEGVVSQLFCETDVDLNQVIGILQNDSGATFAVDAVVHYAVEGGAPWDPLPPATPIDTITMAPGLRAIDVRGIAAPFRAQAGVRAARRARGDRRREIAAVEMIDTSVLTGIQVFPTGTYGGPAGPRRVDAPMSLVTPDRSGARAYFPVSLPENQLIYARVTTGFGSTPWAEWATLADGRFLDAAVAGQYYVLPDEYRLALDRETGQPAMSVFLVPPTEAPTASDGSAPAVGDAGAAGSPGSTSISRDYRIRCRFTVVPWLDPARLERLRAGIGQHAGVVYPDLVIGGVTAARTSLSKAYEALGSSFAGEAAAEIVVDPQGFDLVLDCTSEFYTLLSRLLVAEGLTGSVALDLVSAADRPETATAPLMLRLDRPAAGVPVAEFLPGPPPPMPATEVGAPADGTDGTAPDGTAPDASGDGPPAPSEPSAPPLGPRLRVSNPTPYAVTVGEVRATLLVVDETLPRPIGAVTATPDPLTLTLAAGTPDAPSVVEVALSPAAASSMPPLYGGAGVAFLGVDLDIDANAVLQRAHEVASSGELSGSVELQSYQLAHPEVLTGAVADVFGIEVQLRRGEAEPVTVFLTRDEPNTVVQVEFSLRDLLAGARPEQPTFSWRRRNLAGAGTGDWSEWEQITGRRLFVSPTGL